MSRLIFFLPAVLLLLHCTPDRVPDLGSSDPYARMLGVLDLTVAAEEPGTVSRLEAFLDDPHPLVRDAALIVLSDLGSKASAPKVVARLSDSADHVRIRACRTLVEFGEKQYLGEVVRVYRADESALVRRACAHALARFGAEPGVLAALVEGLGDPDASVRHVSHRQLAALTSKEGIGPDAAAWRRELGLEEKKP